MITNGTQFNNQMAMPQQPLLRPSTLPQPVMENKIDGVSLISSDDQVTNYPVAGGATVALIDLGRKLLVFKTNDIYYGRGIYYETYDLKKREDKVVPPVQNGSPGNEFTDQIQQQINELRKEYDEMYKMLEELTAPKKEANNQ